MPPELPQPRLPSARRRGLPSALGLPARRGRLLALLAPCLLLSLCAQTPADGAETPPEVVEVSFIGNDSIPASRLRGRIATRESNHFLFWGSTALLERGAVEEDERRIRSVYQREGFWAVEVESEILQRGPGRVAVRFFIDEGPPTIVQTLLIDGIGGLPERTRRRLLADLPLQIGERWTQERMEALEAELERRMQEAGYATATVEKLAEISPAEGMADLAFRIEAGEVYSFGDIVIEGNDLTLERRILGAMIPVLEPGERYDPRLLREAQAEIFSLGTFSSVEVLAGEADREKLLVPVRVNVREADFIRLRLGAGAGLEQSFYQIRAIADFSHLDVFQGMQRLDLNNEIAYRFLFGTDRSGIAGNSSLQLTQPDIIGYRTDLAARLMYQRELNFSYQSNMVGGRIGFPIHFRRWLIFTPSYIIEHYYDVETVATPGFSAQPLPPVNCPGGCTFSFLEQSLVVDRRSNPLEPTSGWYLSLGLQEGGGPLGGDFAWLRFLPEARGYIPLSRRVVLALRLQLGLLQPLGSVERCAEEAPAEYDQQVRCSPVVVRFYGGGSAGFRGVGAGRLSPLFAQETRTRGGGEELVFVPLGGNSLSLATAELRWFVSGPWGLVSFLDVGNVGASATDAFEPSEFQYVAGLGVRYRTPVGPARLDLGYRFLRRPLVVINDVRSEDNFFDWFALFLSIGEAF